ncbi:uncharacterized protein LOC134276597 [Saccostrea cucullata]|uniref:uncharacterized protein LOC134276597 n=1 Tax=Saccostrea cuccullata TaxID=36930 RepID=UPI002ED52C85
MGHANLLQKLAWGNYPMFKIRLVAGTSTMYGRNMPPKRKRSRATKAAEPTESQPKRSAPSKDQEIVDTIQNAIQAAIPGITKAVMDEIFKQQTSTDTAIMPSPSAPEGEAANEALWSLRLIWVREFQDLCTNMDPVPSAVHPTMLTL